MELIVAELENERAMPWQERRIGSLPGVPRRDGYGDVGEIWRSRQSSSRAHGQWLLNVCHEHGERRFDGAGRDAVVGDLEEAAQVRCGANDECSDGGAPISPRSSFGAGV